MTQEHPLYYSEYLELDKVLNAQHPRSAIGANSLAHDEMLFIVVHQSFELWFLQVRFELSSVADYLKKEQIDDNSDEMAKIVHRLQRVIKIFKQINEQFDILETMSPLDFLEFRALLAPASGFQSKQFKIIEAMLGLRMNARHMPEHYKNTATHRGGFSVDDYEEITAVERQVSILQALKGWLARMPFLDNRYWEGYLPLEEKEGIEGSRFIRNYFNTYRDQQAAARDEALAAETDPVKRGRIEESYHKSIENFTTLFLEGGTSAFTSSELVSALFIMLYRHCPLLRLPYEMLSSLLEIDELISMWRYRHYLMVKKMIGTRPGTGGSVGAEYLLGAIQSNTVFADLNLLATFFMEEDKLPTLPDDLKSTVNYRMQISDI